MTVDCCEHVIASLKRIGGSDLLTKSSQDLGPPADADMIVIGLARYTVRRLFISQFRKIYPRVPIVILRREITSSTDAEHIRCEFVLSELGHRNDCETVRAVRGIMPFVDCGHLQKPRDYEMVRKLLGVLASRYSDPKLSLGVLARELLISPKRLSAILNRSVGVSFRHLLRQVRIEKAKEMLATPDYSVKQVATLVGFTENHYFSRSFKQLTGQSASEYRQNSAVLN